MTAPTNNGLPAGCPGTARYNPGHHGGVGIHSPTAFCHGLGCTPVEIHPLGSGDRLREVEEALRIYLAAGSKEARREASIIAKRALSARDEKKE